MLSTRIFQSIFTIGALLLIARAPSMAGVPATTAPATPAQASASPAPALSAAQLIGQAQIDAAAGHNDSAADKLHRALALDPKNLIALKLLGDVEYRLENYKDAESAYTTVLAADPTNKDVLNRLGGVYAAEDRFDDAVGAFRRSLPSNEGFANLVQAYEDAGRLGELEGESQADVNGHPFESWSHLNLGIVLTAEKKYSEAATQLQSAIEISPRSAAARNALGVVYGETGRYNDAIDQQKYAISFDPNYASSWMNWGIELRYLYLGSKNIDDLKMSIEKIQHSIDIKPDFAQAYENIGVVYDDLGQFTSAVENLQRAIALDPRDRTVYQNLGVIYLDHNLFNLAEAAFIKGLAIHPRNETLHLALGQTYQKQKKFELAAQQLRIALAENPADQDARELLAQVEAHLGH